MENEFLDELLTKISKENSPYVTTIEGNYNSEVAVTKVRPAIEFLIEKNYLKKYAWGSLHRIEITPQGQKFLLEGGFSQEAKDKKDILLYSKDSKDFARKAYYVSIIGVILSIILFLLSKI